MEPSVPANSPATSPGTSLAPDTPLALASLGSGSSGNSSLIRSTTTTLLLDCGFTLKETLVRLQHLGISPESIDALLVTHEHGDHMRGVGPVSRKLGLPVWMTHGTWGASKDRNIANLNLFHAHEAFTIGDIHLDPFPTPHDAAESCQFVFSVEDKRVACLTDLGACTPHVMDKVRGVNALLVECNYDPEMLRLGPYPRSLQERITSAWGHLANDQAGELVAELDHPELQHILLGHLSEKNNSDAVALDTMTGFVTDRHERIRVLKQHECSSWFPIV